MRRCVTTNNVVMIYSFPNLELFCALDKVGGSEKESLSMLDIDKVLIIFVKVTNGMRIMECVQSSQWFFVFLGYKSH